MQDVTVFYEATPNPQSMKFIVATNQFLVSEPVSFMSAAESVRSPLANKIFGFPWAAGVMLGPNFVTVTKQEWVDWDILAEPLSELIKEHLQRGEPLLYLSSEDEDDDEILENASPIERQVLQILRDEIRPAVAMDGGDISLDRIENGRVYLHMKGACSGCPSSMYTLKEGIETRLKAAIPEIVEVVSV